MNKDCLYVQYNAEDGNGVGACCLYLLVLLLVLEFVVHFWPAHLCRAKLVVFIADLTVLHKPVLQF